jgi:hypothetical protein
MAVVWFRRALIGVGCAALLFGGGASSASADPTNLAQVGGIGGGSVTIEQPPVATGREDVFQKPEARAEDALIWGGWLIYPSGFAGAIYDTNPAQANVARGSAGLRVAPAILAENDNDLFKTKLYGDLDGRFYLKNIPGFGTVLSARAGATETYSPFRDLIINGQADFTRQTDLFSTLGTEQSVVPLNTTGIGLAPTANPQSYDQYSVGATVQKNFAQAFVTLAGSAVDISYDKTAGAVAPSPDGQTYTGTLKGGYWIVPVLYGYIEGSLDSRDYATSTLSSTGYRVVGGVGTDQIGLLKGEVYAGYQQESYRSAALGTAGGDVFGLRGYYYPLPELTVNVSIDESIGVSLLSATPTSPGTSTKVSTYLLNANYALAREWSANGRAGYITTDYIGNPRRDDSWTVGGTVTYNLLRNIGLTADYQHLKLSSNAAGQGFTRDVVTLGATYRY